MPFEFGRRSEEELQYIEPDLVKIFRLALRRSKVDFGISQGIRSISEQKKLYTQGRTEPGRIVTSIDGVRKKSKHNPNEKGLSEAGDIYVYHPDEETRKAIIYDPEHLAYIGGLMEAAAEELLEKGEISSRLRWGGNWDGDGVLLLDQNLDDLPHFEIIKL